MENKENKTIIFFRHNFAFAFAIILMLIAILPTIFVSTRQKHDKDYLLENGIEVVAEITSYDSYINSGMEFIRIHYTYLDEEGNSHKGTATDYMYLDVKKYLDENKIPIKYDPETFQSIEAFYAEIDLSLIVFWIMTIGLWSATILLYIFGIKKGCRNFKENEVFEKGSEYMAKVISMVHCGDFGDTQRYKLKYTWVDENEVEYIGYDTVTYPTEEGETLEKNRTVPIKAMGKYGFVRLGLNLKSVKPYKKEHKCRYCSTKFNGEQCPTCGSFVEHKK